MKKYNITQPLVDGILSDDFMYFEGVKRPTNLFVMKDGASFTESESNILEKYFSDVYNLFLRKVSYFVSVSNPSEEDTVKMQALLQELIKVKKLLIGINESKQKNLV